MDAGPAQRAGARACIREARAHGGAAGRRRHEHGRADQPLRPHDDGGGASDHGTRTYLTIDTPHAGRTRASACSGSSTRCLPFAQGPRALRGCSTRRPTQLMIRWLHDGTVGRAHCARRSWRLRGARRLPEAAAHAGGLVRPRRRRGGPPRRARDADVERRAVDLDGDPHARPGSTAPSPRARGASPNRRWRRCATRDARGRPRPAARSPTTGRWRRSPRASAAARCSLRQHLPRCIPTVSALDLDQDDPSAPSARPRDRSMPTRAATTAVQHLAIAARGVAVDRRRARGAAAPRRRRAARRRPGGPGSGGVQPAASGVLPGPLPDRTPLSASTLRSSRSVRTVVLPARGLPGDARPGRRSSSSIRRGPSGLPGIFQSDPPRHTRLRELIGPGVAAGDPGVPALIAATGGRSARCGRAHRAYGRRRRLRGPGAVQRALRPARDPRRPTGQGLGLAAGHRARARHHAAAGGQVPGATPRPGAASSVEGLVHQCRPPVAAGPVRPCSASRSDSASSSRTSTCCARLRRRGLPLDDVADRERHPAGCC